MDFQQRSSASMQGFGDANRTPFMDFQQQRPPNSGSSISGRTTAMLANLRAPFYPRRDSNGSNPSVGSRTSDRSTGRTLLPTGPPQLREEMGPFLEGLPRQSPAAFRVPEATHFGGTTDVRQRFLQAAALGGFSQFISQR
ncbi:unnamed protein product [Ixodes pacificus]